MRRIIIIISALFLIIGVNIGLIIQNNIELSQTKITLPEKAKNYPNNLQSELINENTVRILAPAVSKDGQGMIIPITVEAKPGSGKIFTDIENILFWADTQQSIKTSTTVAQKFSNRDLSNIDLIYTIDNPNISLIGGGSAGAALSLATIAAIENQNITNNIIITGAVDEKGNIYAVSSIEEKAKASSKAGINLFLVPKGQASSKILTPVKECQKKNNKKICEVKYKEKLTELGVKLKEVTNIKEAAEYYGLVI